MLAFLKDSLGGKVSSVILSQKLKTHPVCLSTSGAISMEMEKVLNSMPNVEKDKVKSQRVLEINANHPIFEKLCGLYQTDKDTLKAYASLLYEQALLIEGVPVDDPVDFSNRICDLMAK
jgi:molecular chaperone HtpG